MSRARGSQLYALLLRLYPKASRQEYGCSSRIKLTMPLNGLIAAALGALRPDRFSSSSTFVARVGPIRFSVRRSFPVLAAYSACSATNGSTRLARNAGM